MTENEQRQIMAEVYLRAEGTPLFSRLYQDERADYRTHEFIVQKGVSIWYGQNVVVVLKSVAEWQTFKTVCGLIADERWFPDVQ